MSAFVKYGTYSHPPGLVDVQQQRQTLFNEADNPYATLERWVLNVTLVSQHPTNPQGDLDAKLAALKTAYAQNGKDVKLLMPNGSTASQLAMISSQAIGGVRVIRPPSITTLQRAGMVTNVEVTIELEAEFPLPANQRPVFRSFTEELVFEGGAAIDGWLYPHQAPPVKQRLRQRDTFRATQSGTAVGLYGYPPIPLPKFFGHQVGPRAPSQLRSPTPRANGFQDFSRSWEYRFESNFPLVGIPHAWSGG